MSARRLEMWRYQIGMGDPVAIEDCIDRRINTQSSTHTHSETSMLGETQRKIISQFSRVSERDYIAQAARNAALRTARNMNNGGVDSNANEPFPAAMRRIAASDQDFRDDETPDDLVDRALGHLDAYDAGSGDPDGRLVAAAANLLAAIERLATGATASAQSSRRLVVKFQNA